MDARATLRRSPNSTRFYFALVAALVAALVLGWIGGYIVRGLAVSAPATQTITTPPAIAPSPEPTRDPKGFAVPI